jgi:soluble lytic murein transglycosylase-like protein
VKLAASVAVALLVAASTGAVRAQESDGTPVAQQADPSTVAALCRRARLGDANSQYELAWIFTHARAEERRDDWAHYLFFAAAANGNEDARKVLLSVTWPQADVPDCIRRPPLASVGPSVALRAPPHIERLVQQLAPQFNVSPKLALAIIAVESNFDSAALSNKNAMGLMQLIPDTARRFGVRNAFDPQQNIRGGMAYLRWLLAYYQGDVRLVAAAYNAGEGAVDKHRGVPPFAETQDYVRRVVERFGNAPHPFDARITAPSRQAGSGVARTQRTP